MLLIKSIIKLNIGGLMPQKISQKDFGLTPGQIYKGITTVSEDFEGETKAVVEQDPDFVRFCKGMRKQFPGFAKNATFSDKHAEAVRFLGWRLSAGDFACALKGSAVYAAIPGGIIILVALLLGVGLELGGFNTASFVGGPIFSSYASGMESVVFFVLVFMVFGFAGAYIYSIYTTPIVVAEDEKNRALTYVPEMVGYMVMSMKLVPNLEKAIEFSAKHGRGKVSSDFKRLIWDFQIGVYTSIAEGLDALAYRWGVYSSELKESLMKIRASVMEPSEARRYQILDKTMLEVLDSVKTKMEDYARSLNQPSVMLFYLGVLLPLILIIILPVGSAFSGAPLAQPILLIMIYCVAIPYAAFRFAKNVITKRPPTYEPPIIPDDFPELPKKWQVTIGGFKTDSRIVFVLILLVGFVGSYVISTQGFPPLILLPANDDDFFSSGPAFQLLKPDRSFRQVLIDEKVDEDKFGKITDLILFDLYDIKTGSAYIEYTQVDGLSPSDAELKVMSTLLKFNSNPRTDSTRLVLWGGFILTIIFALCFLLYNMTIHKRNAQLNVIKMEDEFKESMYVIASRMGENKPVENALKSARDFLPNLSISQRIFGKTVENIELMGLPLDSAVFDPLYGSMKNIPSKTLDTAMHLLVDSVSLGVEVASRTLMSLSLQLENMDKVNKSLKDMVSDVTTTMSTMAIFIGPMVLGITVALQKVVMNTLANVVSDPTFTSAEQGASDIGSVAGQSFINVESIFQVDIATFQTFASPLVFFLIIAFYVIEIVVILLYFTTKIQEDNDLLFRVNLAKNLPIAVAVFTITVIVSNAAITMIMGKV